MPQNQDIIVKSLGHDGGAVCDNPASALGKAVQNDQLTNGADFVGRRPVIVDRRILRGRGADPGDVLPGEARGLPRQDRRPENRRHDQALSGSRRCPLTICARRLPASWAAPRTTSPNSWRSSRSPTRSSTRPRSATKAAQWVIDAFTEVGLEDVAAVADSGRQQGGARPCSRPDGQPHRPPVLPLRRPAAARRGEAGSRRSGSSPSATAAGTAAARRTARATSSCT